MKVAVLNGDRAEGERLTADLRNAVDGKIVARLLGRQPSADELRRVREAWADAIRLSEEGASAEEAMASTTQVYRELGMKSS
jgi:hypothetical protein